jgi:tetratricopeptide (TPR) repeat protein
LLHAAIRAACRGTPGIIGAALAAASAWPALAAAQLGAGVTRMARLELTTSSAEARTEFWAALDDFNNIFTARATTRLKKALELDPAFGLARVLYGGSGVGLARHEREQEMERGVVDAARASTSEALVAMGLREWFKGDAARARALMHAATELLPGDPNIAYLSGWLAADGPGGDRSDVVRAMKDVNTRFPDFAPAYNVLAYDLWRAGDRAGALRAVEAYVQKAPAHPNSHDSYAELLQWDGRLDEAAMHYRKAIDLDPSYTEAAIGLAEVHQLQGRGDLARAAIGDAIARAPDADAKVAYLRALAAGWLLDGNPRQAQTQLAAAAAAADEAGLREVEATIHLHMAVLDGAFGTGREIAAHVAAATEAANPALLHVWAGVAYALGRQPDAARRAIHALSEPTSAAASPEQTSRIATLNAMLLLNDGKAREALEELSRANQQLPVPRAILALAHARVGNTTTARSIRDQMVADRDLSFTAFGDVLGRQLVKQIR